MREVAWLSVRKQSSSVWFYSRRRSAVGLVGSKHAALGTRRKARLKRRVRGARLASVGEAVRVNLGRETEREEQAAAEWGRSKAGWAGCLLERGRWRRRQDACGDDDGEDKQQQQQQQQDSSADGSSRAQQDGHRNWRWNGGRAGEKAAVTQRSTFQAQGVRCSSSRSSSLPPGQKPQSLEASTKAALSLRPVNFRQTSPDRD
ncbi:hypothetical protein BJ546DRAFT_948527 [Cryomyces antarcticus]